MEKGDKPFEKQVVMTYKEHERWLASHKEWKEKESDLHLKLKEQEKMIDELMDTSPDVVVMTRHSVKVGERHVSRGLGYGSTEGVYINFPRFHGKDEVAKELDDAFMELRAEILGLQSQLRDTISGREKDKRDFFTGNVTCAMPWYDSLSRRDQKRLRKLIIKGKEKCEKT